ncbi:hypothetical protein [Dyadobacter bucti]|uniref:hypothetical protein n=1 Tax=Dyadobacter bucti TaxID=2572203 RepID=UPI003F730411
MFKSLFPKRELSSGIFIQNGDSFSELTEKPENGSINGIAIHLGYHPDQVHTYWGEFDLEADIQQIVLEVFTKKIVFVLTKTTVKTLRKSMVDQFMKKFNWVEEYDSVKVEDILQEGIANSSLNIDFLARVLFISEPEDTGVFYVGKIGKYLYFNNGFLTDYNSADGLNTWARSWKEINPDFIGLYENAARKHWGDNHQKVYDEINLQAEAYANVPGGLLNEFIPLHKTGLDTVNFVMLMVCHYGATVTLEEFKVLNHGRYVELAEDAFDLRSFQLGVFKYTFLSSGNLVDFCLS